MTNVKGQRLGITPQWLVALPEVYRSLTLEVSKNEAPNILAALSRDKIDQKYSQYVQIYSTRTRQKTHQEKWELAAIFGRSRHLQTSRWKPG